MKKTYFTDSEYRLLLSALAREEKICRQVDEETGNEPVLANMVRSVKRKIADTQYNKIPEVTLCDLTAQSISSLGYLLLRGAISSKVHAEDVLEELTCFINKLSMVLKKDSAKKAVGNILKEELAEGTYLDDIRNSLKKREIFQEHEISAERETELIARQVFRLIGDYISEVLACDESDAYTVATLYEELAGDILNRKEQEVGHNG